MIVKNNNNKFNVCTNEFADKFDVECETIIFPSKNVCLCLCTFVFMYVCVENIE